MYKKTVYVIYLFLLGCPVFSMLTGLSFPPVEIISADVFPVLLLHCFYIVWGCSILFSFGFAAYLYFKAGGFEKKSFFGKPEVVFIAALLNLFAIAFSFLAYLWYLGLRTSAF